MGYDTKTRKSVDGTLRKWAIMAGSVDVYERDGLALSFMLNEQTGEFEIELKGRRRDRMVFSEYAKAKECFSRARLAMINGFEPAIKPEPVVYVDFWSKHERAAKRQAQKDRARTK